MALWKTEKPDGGTHTLKDLYPDDADQIESNIGFVIYRAGQRTFRKNWYRVARKGGLPDFMSGGDLDGEALNQSLMQMLLTPDGFEAGFDLVSKGVIADIEGYPEEGGKLSDVSNNGDRMDALRELLDDEAELMLQLIMACFTAEADKAKAAQEIAGESSASSPAQEEKPIRKSDG